MKLSSEQQAKLFKRAQHQFTEAIELKKKSLTDHFLNTLVTMAETIVRSIANGGKLMLCGNGGSAADAQHLAGELLVRLRSHVNRDAIPAMPLALDSTTLTACANDYGFESIYERMVQGLGRKEDILLGLSTSGRSQNVIRALKSAKQKGIITLGFLGSGGGPMLSECDLSFIVPSTDPNRVQEIHITAGHILMDLIEGLMLEHKYINELSV